MNDPVTYRPAELLLVEDSPSDALLTQEMLKDAQVLNPLHVVTDGIEALSFLRRQGAYNEAPRPDLVLLDLYLPKKDGWEVLREIRADDMLRAIPCVVTTSSTSGEDIRKSYEAGASFLVNKPLNLEQFRRIVTALDRFRFSIMALPEDD